MACEVLFLAVQKVGCHEQLQCNLRCNGELWYLCTAVGVANFVVKIHADLAQDMRAARGGGGGGMKDGRERGGEDE